MNFKKLISELGVTRYRIAVDADLSYGTILNLAAGKPPNIKTIKKLYKHWNISTTLRNGIPDYDLT